MSASFSGVPGASAQPPAAPRRADVHRDPGHICQAPADASDASQLWGMPRFPSWGPDGAASVQEASHPAGAELRLSGG